MIWNSESREISDYFGTIPLFRLLYVMNYARESRDLGVTLTADLSTL